MACWTEFDLNYVRAFVQIIRTKLIVEEEKNPTKKNKSTRTLQQDKKSTGFFIAI